MTIGAPFSSIVRRAYAALNPGNRNWQYDIQTIDVMAKLLRRDSNCVDVGCHRGDILKEMLRLAPGGEHFAFEPIPSMFKRLQRSFDLPNVRLFSCALDDASGTSTFQHVVSNPAYSGLRRRKYDRPNESVKEIVVDVRRLDDVLPRAIAVRLIKIDVEGAELLVLRGAVETIKTHQPVVIFEHGLGGLESYNTHPQQIYELLTDQCGLRIYVMKDWLGGHGPLAATEFVRRVMTDVDYYFMAYV